MKHSTITVEGVQPADNFVVEYPSSAVSSGIYARFGKRIFDLMISIVAAPVLVPVIAILWFVVRRDGGPGMFVQERVGKDGKVFRCCKLRTMVMDAEKVLEDMCASDPVVAHEWKVNQKLKHDPRITKVGKVLRETSLDELPQFFNVVRGEMSFVGPRPFLPSQKADYDQAGGRAYYGVRPGVTGLWQVEGRGETSFVGRVGFDETYGEKHSLRYDIGLMFKTVAVVLKKTGH
jgi:lipopolysaccharide/colanic/teichoic acid biosynthesis glycosyltransferase